MNFEWDDKKATSNLKKHGVSFTEAIESFFDPHGLQLIDTSHSDETEKRYYWVGKSNQERVITTYLTKRGDKIRIIGSAEWRKFRRIYETAKNE